MTRIVLLCLMITLIIPCLGIGEQLLLISRGDRAAWERVADDGFPPLFRKRAHRERERCFLEEAKLAVARGDFETALEHLGRIRQKPDTGYEGESRDLEARIPTIHMQYTRHLRDRGAYADAKGQCARMRQLYLPPPHGLDHLYHECWLGEIDNLLQQQDFDTVRRELHALLSANCPIDLIERTERLFSHSLASETTLLLARADYGAVMNLLLNERARFSTNPQIQRCVVECDKALDRHIFGEPRGEGLPQRIPGPIPTTCLRGKSPEGIPHVALRFDNGSSSPLDLMLRGAASVDTLLTPGEMGEFTLPAGNYILSVVPDTEPSQSRYSTFRLDSGEFVQKLDFI